jgi:actin
MFNVLSFYVDIQAVLSLFSSWRTTDILLESRDEATQIVPIYEDYLLSHAIIKLNLTGRDLTALMIKLLKESKLVFNNSREINYSKYQRKVFICFS